MARKLTIGSTVNLAFNQRIAIPSNIYCAVGRELNIWYDSILHSFGDDVKVNFSCSSTYAASKERCFRYTPLATETSTVTITVRNRAYNLLTTKTFTLNAVSKTNGGGATKQFLFIGDSLTSQGVYPTEFAALFTADGGLTPYFLGTQGSSPSRHEGRPGWTYGDFVISGSPFWDATNSRLDFQAYMSTNSNFSGSNAIDYSIIQLGINEVLSASSNSAIETAITNAKTLVDGILHSTRGYPTCKIIICIPPICCNTHNGFAVNYGATKNKEQYEYYMRYLWEQLIANFETSVYSSNVSLNATGLWIDRTNGYNLSDTNISARNTIQVSEHTNAVHPVASGHNQIVDAIYSRVRGLL